jgi:hypothetical protein
MCTAFLRSRWRGQSRKVVGIVIHVMASTGLGGAAVAPSVMSDDAIAVFEEEQHLRIPVIGRERPTMTEDDGLSFAPIFIIDVDVSSVLFSDGDVWHCGSPFFCSARLRHDQITTIAAFGGFCAATSG